MNEIGSSFSAFLRLRGDDFSRVFKEAVPFRVQGITLLARSNGLVYPRFGFVIGKKQVKKAYLRNRLKRVLRESFRHKRIELPAVDMVAVIYQRGLPVDKVAFAKRVDDIWKQLNAYYKPLAAD